MIKAVLIFCLLPLISFAAPLAEHPFVKVYPEAMSSWSAYYKVVECIECPTAYHQDGEVQGQLKGIVIGYTLPITSKDHWKTPFAVTFGEYREKDSSVFSSFGRGLSSYKSRTSDKKKLTSLGIREHKFYYYLRNDFYNEYDEIEINKNENTGELILTRSFKYEDPSFNKVKAYSYKVRLKRVTDIPEISIWSLQQD